MSRQRDRKSSSSMTNSGVPYSAASSVTGTPAIDDRAVVAANGVARPDIRRQGDQLGGGLRALRARRRGGFLGVARDRRGARSHPLRRADAEDAQTVGEDLAGRLAQRQPGGVQIGRLLVALRQHPAGAVEAVVGAGEVLEVAATRCGSRSAAAVVSTRGNSPMLRISVPSLVVGQQVEVRGVGGDAELGGIARQRREPRVRVLHVVDRVFVALHWSTARDRCRSAVHRDCGSARTARRRRRWRRPGRRA